MTWQDNLGVHLLGTNNGCVEVVDLEPQEYTVSVGFEIWIPDGAMMVLDIPSVQLHDQPAVRDQPFIFGAAMPALTTQQTLKPATARFDIVNANERLWVHRSSAV